MLKLIKISGIFHQIHYLKGFLNPHSLEVKDASLQKKP